MKVHTYTHGNIAFAFQKQLHKVTLFANSRFITRISRTCVVVVVVVVVVDVVVVVVVVVVR
jgi:hypothetical protein